MANARYELSRPDREDRPRVKLFGLGSAGCRIIDGAPFAKVAVSGSPSDLDRSHADRKVMISPDRLVGIAHSDPSALRQIPTIAGQELLDLFNNTELAFIACGLGGPTGSHAAKIFSLLAASKGSMDIVLAAMPFSAESPHRRELAEKILSELLNSATLCIRFDNDDLSTLAPQLPAGRAFGLMNGIMQRPILDLCAVTSRKDMPVLRQALSRANLGRFGLGLARGDDRVVRVVEEALSSPWFDRPREEALVAVAAYSAADPWDREAERIVGELERHLPNASLLWGSYADPGLGERIRLSLVLCADKT